MGAKRVSIENDRIGDAGKSLKAAGPESPKHTILKVLNNWLGSLV
jgi:hypothetical protein